MSEQSSVEMKATHQKELAAMKEAYEQELTAEKNACSDEGELH